MVTPYSKDDKLNMVSDVTNEKIKDVLFSMPKEKSLGSYGFTMEFFVFAWSIVGTEVLEAVKEFFRKGGCLRRQTQLP